MFLKTNDHAGYHHNTKIKMARLREKNGNCFDVLINRISVYQSNLSLRKATSPYQLLISQLAMLCHGLVALTICCHCEIN